jgi:aromatic-L-amino-acid decarboxylase
MKPNIPSSSDTQEHSLDPENWDEYRAHAHTILNACIDKLQNAKNQPWQPVDQTAQRALMPDLPRQAKGTSDIVQSLIQDVMPHATGNTHPRFFGWVHGTGLASCFLSDMVASAMNSNCGGRDHGAIYVERCVLDWCKEIFGFSKNASGLLTVGTSQATVLALVTARNKILGMDVREHGIQNAPELKVYCAQGTHACVKKALQIMGHGSQALCEIPSLSTTSGMNITALKDQIETDIANGIVPLAIAATAGSVNTGAFDDLNAIADLCEEHGIWMHIDGAFGAWAHIAEAPWSDLTSGIHRADSLAFDFHKWMSVQYDCGAILMKDADLHYDSFATRPSYLTAQSKGLGGGDLWFCDFGTDLSRGFRALKVWTALQDQGLDGFSKAITANCKQANYMAELVEADGTLTLAAPVIANVCNFYAASDELSAQDQDVLNTNIVHHLQLTGQAVFSTTQINGRTVIRAAIVNHRTKFKDIELSINAVLDAVKTLA